MKYNNQLIFMASLMSLFMLPFIISNIYYVDDIYRSITGFGGWSGMGRPIADLLNLVFSLKYGTTVDIAPLPQIIAGVGLFFSILACSNALFIKPTYITTLILFPIISNPFFIQNLAYRYDSLSMSAAVLSVCSSFYFARKPCLRNLLLSILLSFASLCLYQSAINILIGLTALAIIVDYHLSKRVLRNCVTLFSVFIISNVFYLLAMKLTGINSSGRGEIDVLGAMERLSNYSDYFSNALGVKTHTIILFLIILSYLSIFTMIFINKRDNKSSKIDVLLLLFSPFVAFISIFGALPLLAGQSPQPRILTGAASFFVYLNTCMYVLSMAIKSDKYQKIVMYCFLVPVSLFMLSIPYAFVNAQSKQTEFDLRVINNVANDIDKQININDYDKVTTLGGTPDVRQVFVNSKQLPLVKEMVSSMYDFTSYLYLRDMYVKGTYFDFNRSKTKVFVDKNKHRATNKISTNRYVIYNIDRTLYVDLNNKW